MTGRHPKTLNVSGLLGMPAREPDGFEKCALAASSTVQSPIGLPLTRNC
jgi:hypothetical protein